ncbi:calmodulin-like 3 [Dinochytrium kinnereticum]|nr:calmodulin-like 3 [Dinochytrium kinnereticum]
MRRSVDDHSTRTGSGSADSTASAGRRTARPLSDGRNSSVVGFPPLDGGRGRESPMQKSSRIEEHDDLPEKTPLSQEQKDYYKEAFHLFDKDHNGFIDIEELRDVMISLGIPHTPEDLQGMISKVDVDNTGTIDFEEFLVMIENFGSFAVFKTERQIKEAFDAMDSDNNGYISAADLLAVLSGLGEELSGEEALEMIRHADLDGDGQVSMEDFKKLLKVWD